MIARLSRTPGVGRLLALYARHRTERFSERFEGRYVEVTLRNGVKLRGRVAQRRRRP